MKSRQASFTQELSAAKAGISVRSGRRIEKGERPAIQERNWRTRRDPFEAVWESELIPLLDREPSLTGITLWDYLDEKYPEQYPEHFLLHLGYFKARQRFYVIDIDLMSEDIAYLSKLYFEGTEIHDLNVSKHTRRLHVSWILELFGFRQADQAERLSLEERALKAARISSRPVYVLRDLVDRLRQQRIVLPGYTYLQDVVRRALLFERYRLSHALNTSMTAEDKRMLDRFRLIQFAHQHFC